LSEFLYSPGLYTIPPRWGFLYLNKAFFYQYVVPMDLKHIRLERNANKKMVCVSISKPELIAIFLRYV